MSEVVRKFSAGAPASHCPGFKNCEDADTAQGRCYLIDLHTVTKAEREPWILLGSYADEYRRIDGQWRITRSQLDVFWPSRNAGGGLPGDGLVLP